MYQKGWGVKRDYSQAYDLYLKAANQGNNFAQASLGLLYYEGWGVQKDLEKSLTWYKKAAVQGHKTAIRRCKEIEQILANRIDSSQINFPIPAFITGDKVNVRSNPNIESYSRKQLYSGHPVSVSRRSSETDGDWFYISTASGTNGWVRGDYVRFSDNVTRTQQERENRKYLLPSRGIVSKIQIGNRTGTQLNLRSFPHTDTSNIIREISTGDNFTALDIFAEEERDWYRIRTYDSGTEGWVSGRFINLQ